MIKQQIKDNFTAWWARDNYERPLVSLLAMKKNYDKSKTIDIGKLVKSDYDRHFNPSVQVGHIRNCIQQLSYMADSFPYANLNLGPGSMACYLKCQPVFQKDTVWYKEIECESIEELLGISYEKSTVWFQEHLSKLKEALDLANGDFPVAIPDILENIDIVSAMRGSQNLCYDLYDEPHAVKQLIDIIDNSYFKYYDEFYNLLKLNDNSSVYTAFSIWGQGKTAKVQCDMAALLSCDAFDEFVLPSLNKQCLCLDNVLFHLDGKDAIRHVDSLMTVDKINAINWTPGDGQPDAGDECWFPLYDKIIGAGKGLWLGIGQGSVDRWISCTKKIQKRYGNKGLYFLYGITDENSAKRLLKEINY